MGCTGGTACRSAADGQERRAGKTDCAASLLLPSRFVCLWRRWRPADMPGTRDEGASLYRPPPRPLRRSSSCSMTGPAYQAENRSRLAADWGWLDVCASRDLTTPMTTASAPATTY